MKDYRQNPATASNAPVRPMCFVCEKQIVDNNWFCRVPQKRDGATGPQDAEILLCSPFCALRYFGDSQPAGNGFEPGYDGSEYSPQVSGGGQTQKASKARRVPNAVVENNN